MANQILSELAKRAPQIALGILAARQGGPQAAAAFQQGLLERQQAEETRTRQGQLDTERRQAAAAQEARAASAEGRAVSADARAAEDQKLQRVNSLMSALSNYDADPSALASLYQVPAEQVNAVAAPIISARDKRKAKETLDGLSKSPLYQGYFQSPESLAELDEQSIVWKGAPIKIRELRMMAEQTVTPKVAAKIETPNTTEESHIADAIAIAEEKKGSVLTRGERAQARLAAVEEYARTRGQAGDRPRPTGPTEYQQFTMGEKLAAAWTKANAPVREVDRQLRIMRVGLQRFRGGDKNGGSQAVLVTFQKILDPTSVVRESEYARTTDGQAFLNRIEGYLTRLAEGGTTLTDSELGAMVQTAEAMYQSMAAWKAGTRRRIEASAKEFNIKPALVFDDEIAPDVTGTMPAPGPAPQAAPGGSSYQDYLKSRGGPR